MICRWSLVCAALLLAFGRVSLAQNETQPAAPAETSAKAAVQAELDAIRATGDAFNKAFDSGDAKAVAALWTEEGEFVDESGRRLQGREAIEKEYAAFFKANPGSKVTTKIDSLRLINAESAIEDGTDAVEPPPAGAPGKSRYTAVHVKRDGKWFLWSVRETRVDVPTNYGRLENLEGMIGTWTAENTGVEFEATSRWIADKNFIEQSYKSQQGGQVIASGTQIIGWDPVAQRITSWSFTSEGGHAVGLWHPQENGWIIETSGTLIDGTPTSAVNIISVLDKNAIAWRSVNRTAGAFQILDTNEVVLKRKVADSPVAEKK